MIQQWRTRNWRALSFAFRIINADIQIFRIANPKEQRQQIVHHKNRSKDNTFL